MISDNKKSFIQLIIIFIITLAFCGGYYEYISAIIGAFLAVYVIVYCQKFSIYKVESNIITCKNFLEKYNYVVVTAFISLMYFITSIYAVDTGMALTGAVKKSAPLLFAISLLALNRDYRQKIIDKLPEIAALLTIAAAVCALIPVLRPYIITAGRFCGTFGYANTYALFILLALIVLLETFNQRKSYVNIIITVILLSGMWFSGSRYTWVLTFICLIIYAFHKKEMRKYTSIVIAVLAAATMLAGVLFKNSETIGRFFSTNLSTLYGRFLYWQDGLMLAVKHPFGMGYLGYYYKETQIQTGVYTVRFVHNDWLQLILDIGFIPFLIIAAFLLKVLCSKSYKFINKLLIFTIAVHSFMEFDMEHTGIVFILLIILSCKKETEKENLPDKKTKPKELEASISTKPIAIILGILCIYFSIPLCLYAVGKNKSAAMIYPIYTDAQLANLSSEKDYDKASQIADKILSQNDTAFLAYDAKAMVAWNKLDYEGMVHYKKEAIKRNKFDYSEYSDYLVMLNEALSYYLDNGDDISAMKVVSDMKELLTIIKENKSKVSRLGKMIDDKVKIDLPDEIVSQIEEMG